MTLQPRTVLGAAIAVVVLALPLLPVPEFWITQLNLIGLYAIVALGLVLLTGVGGLTSFGQAAFVGVGAYSTAVLTTQLALSPWLGLLVGIAITVAIALVLAAITLRMSGHYLPLATIAWGLSLSYTMANVEGLGRYDGILGIPAIEVFGISLHDGRKMYVLIWLVALAAALATQRLLDSRPGRAIRALKGGAAMAEAMGISTYRYKVVIFVYAAVLAAISGWLFAHYQRAVNPTPFGLNRGIEYLFMAVLGGVGQVWGAFVGAGAVKLIEDKLQVWLPALTGTNGNYEVIVFGVLIVLLLKYAPDGLWPAVSRWLERWLPLPRRAMDWAAAARLSERSRPTPGEVLLQVQSVRKEFGGLVAVNDVSFDLRAGEIVGLIGPNGAGKSTTFNLLTGTLALTRGTATFAGHTIAGLPARAIARLGVSRTFQHVKLLPEMTVLDNVALGAHQRGHNGALRAMLRLDRDEEHRFFAEAQRQLQRIGMGAQLHELAGNLPLGPQRLMEIARALCADPVLLLLDEPAEIGRAHV